MAPCDPLSEAEIRVALRSWLAAAHAAEHDIVVLEELGLCRGQARIDLAVVNGLLHGYEIKSARDCLRRLGGQVELYSRVVDQATLVVADRHLTGAMRILPPWWGVLRLTCRGPRFRTVRRAGTNPARDPRALAELLWLEDALALLESRLVARGVRGKPRWMVWDRVCAHYGVDEIASAVRASLKVRKEMPDSP